MENIVSGNKFIVGEESIAAILKVGDTFTTKQRTSNNLI